MTRTRRQHKDPHPTREAEAEADTDLVAELVDLAAQQKDPRKRTLLEGWSRKGLQQAMQLGQPLPAPELKQPADLDVLLRMDFAPEGMQLFAGGEVVDRTARQDLLRQLRGGEVVELELDALVYRQSKTPRPLPASKRSECNAAFACFQDPASLAPTFKGRPFLRDHDRGLLAAGGEVLASELVDDGWIAFQQKLSLRAPWAVESALMGTLRTFSIAWQPKTGGLATLRESMYCTVCQVPMFGPQTECKHLPSDEVKLDGAGVNLIVELEWRNVVGRETSGVTFPAVQGTGIEAIRAALQEHGPALRAAVVVAGTGGAPAPTPPPSQAPPSNPAADVDVVASALCEAAGLPADMTATRAVVAMKLSQAASMAEGIASARQYLADLMQAKPTQAPVNALGMSAEQERMAASVGLTPEQWRKHNPPEAAQAPGAPTAAPAMTSSSAAVRRPRRGQAEEYADILAEQARAAGALHPDDWETEAKILEAVRRSAADGERFVRELQCLLTQGELHACRLMGMDAATWLKHNKPRAEGTLGLTEGELAACRQLGITPAQYRRHNPAR